MNFFSELQRRHVYKVGAAYAVAGWLLAQAITQVLPVFGVSALGQRLLVLVVVAGFPVALVLAWLFDVTPEGIVRTDALPAAGETPKAQRERRGMDRKLNLLLGALVLLGVGFLVAERTVLRGALAPAAGNDKSIAVLPFENLSRDPDNAYFATGMQDEILTRLSKVRALKVISRTSTQHFASSPDNLPEIARKLGVSAILEGSVQKAGDKVHVNVQLIRALTDEHLWAESYDRRLDDIFAVQGEVAQAVAEALRATLTGAEQQALAAKPTTNTKAYENYLRGLAMESRYSSSTEDFRARVAVYQAAVDLDPDFALAWSGLARAQTELYLTTETTPQQLALARRALGEATRLAPEASESYEALAFFRYYGLRDYDGAFEAYTKALQTRPNAGRMIYAMGNVRRRQGRWQEALSLQSRATELDPLSTETWFNLALSLRALHRYDEAHATLDRGLAAAPGDLELLAQKAQTYQMQGELAAAGKLLEQWPADSGNPDVISTRLDQWRYQRDFPRAIRESRQILKHRASLPSLGVAILLSGLGADELLNGERAAGIADLSDSRKVAEQAQQDGNGNALLTALLSRVQALLGDRESAYRNADLAAKALENDALLRPLAKIAQAFARMHGGDKAQAVALLAEVLAAPDADGVSSAILRIDPDWDGLRDDPRFRQLIAGAGPPVSAEARP